MATEETCKETEHRTTGHGYPQEININNKSLSHFYKIIYIKTTLQHLPHKDLEVFIKGERGENVFHVNEDKISP